jgi:hypothetical protein
MDYDPSSVVSCQGMYSNCTHFVTSRPVFTHGPQGPRPRAANFRGRHIKKIEIEVWYAGKKGCPLERNLREICTENIVLVTTLLALVFSSFSDFCFYFVS